MTFRGVAIWCAGLALLAAGCAGGGGASGVSGASEADVKAVKDLEAAWVRDFSAKDPEKLAAYFTDDASALNPYEPVVTGKEKIKASLKAMVSDPNFALTFQSTRVDESKAGDMIYTVGTYSMTMTDAIDKKPVTDKGKYLTIFKKQGDGSWKAVADMFNSDQPPPSATYR